MGRTVQAHGSARERALEWRTPVGGGVSCTGDMHWQRSEEDTNDDRGHSNESQGDRHRTRRPANGGVRSLGCHLADHLTAVGPVPENGTLALLGL